MSKHRSLSIYLDDIPLRRAQKGNFNLINLITGAFERRAFRVQLCRNSAKARLTSASDPGYSLFHMDDPLHPRSLTLRRAYYYPFWRIEASAKRWEWEIARTRFQLEKIDAAKAAGFAESWRKRLFDISVLPSDREPIVYVPLQGRLLTQRSFQTSSPLDMLKAILKHEPDRRICVSFHPTETYRPLETNSVQALAKTNPRLSIVDEPMVELLRRCAYVATQNSSVALAGYFFHKPAALFARIDFHHIAANVITMGATDALRAAPTLTPDFDRYLYWFLQLTAINGGAPDAEDRIIESVQRHGWDI